MKYLLKNLTETLPNLPQEPGVYIFRGGDTILYVGKANILPTRLASYMGERPAGDPKTVAMLSDADSVEIIITHNPEEALLLEMNLIRKHTPHYNIEIRNFPYIKISDETYPLISISRENPQKTPGKFIGPFTDATNMRRNLYLINRAFRLRTCHHNLDTHPPTRPCLDFEMDICDAPCASEISADEYAKRIEQAKQFITGKRQTIFHTLENRMKKAAADMRYEDAAKYRDMIYALKQAAQGQRAVSRPSVNLDAVAIDFIDDSVYCVILKVREGLLIDRWNYVGETPVGDVVEQFLIEHYNESDQIPPTILLRKTPNEIDDIVTYLSNIRGTPVDIIKPHRGNNASLLAMAYKNLKYLIDTTEIDKAKRGELTEILEEIGAATKLDNPPRVIELIDISNTGATSIVASLVTFVDAIADKSRYRRYRIKGIDGQDDFASIASVTKRRFKRVKSGEEPPPDLFVVDGGKGQLSAALESLRELELEGQPIAAIAKGKPDELYIPYRDVPVLLSDKAILLLGRIRDEAHRFAITYHRKLRGKSIKRSILDEVAGVGAQRKKVLLRHFGSVEKIAQASIEEIAETPGIPKAVAEAIFHRLHNAATPKTDK